MGNDARERIIEACERVIARGGLRGFRMGDVAREAGVSIGLLSYHFGDRDGLLQAARGRGCGRSRDRGGGRAPRGGCEQRGGSPRGTAVLGVRR
jgi:AcrR family transcriptional regulator